MSEQTSATWLIPPRSNSGLRLRGLITSSSPCRPEGHEPSEKPGETLDLNPTSDSDPINGIRGADADHRASRTSTRRPRTAGPGRRSPSHQRFAGRRAAMTRDTSASGAPGVTRQFIGVDSPTARRAGSGGHPCQGLYYRGMGRKPKVAVIATHYQIDFSEHYIADYLATRGIGFLGWNTRFRGYESSFLLDHA